MALIVEDGTGLATAESYVSESDADTYVSKYLRAANTNRVAWEAATSANKEIALRQATAWLDITYREIWKGRRVREEQALAWPRYSVVDEDGFAIDSDVVPQVLKDACAEMATRGVGEDLFADVSAPSGSVVKERNKVGPLETEVEYAGSSSQQKAYVKASEMLRGLLESWGSRSKVERS